MNPAEESEDLDVISRPVWATRLIFLASLAFWPLFLAGVLFMLDAPAKTTKALMVRRLLVDGTWCYPLAVGLAWFLCRRAIKKGGSDAACLWPWLIPTLIAVYWLLSFFI